jgi:polygalacturonase
LKLFAIGVSSAGSLGKDKKYATVEHVYVKNCTFNGTSNGARIKTYEVRID